MTKEEAIVQGNLQAEYGEEYDEIIDWDNEPEVKTGYYEPEEEGYMQLKEKDLIQHLGTLYLSLEGLREYIQFSFEAHRIEVKDKNVWKGFEKHYQHILELEDYQDKYLETVKLMYEIVMQHPLVDGNKRLSAYVFSNLLYNSTTVVSIEEIVEKIGD